MWGVFVLIKQQLIYNKTWRNDVNFDLYQVVIATLLEYRYMFKQHHSCYLVRVCLKIFLINLFKCIIIYIYIFS